MYRIGDKCTDVNNNHYTLNIHTIIRSNLFLMLHYTYKNGRMVDIRVLKVLDSSIFYNQY
jgi:hypothetical protein